MPFDKGEGVVKGAGRTLPTSLSTEYVYLGGQMIASKASGAYTFYAHDHLSIRGIMPDANPNSFVKLDTLPFGESWYGSGTKWNFTSYERDSDVGDDYAMARRYQYTYGRFSSADPIFGDPTNPQSWNRYAYVQSDPINWFDPLGLLQAGPVCPPGTHYVGENPDTFQPNCAPDDPGGGGGGVSCIDFYMRGLPCPGGGGKAPGDPGGGGGGGGGGGTVGQRRDSKAKLGVGPEACSIYNQTGRPDLSFFCRYFPGPESAWKRCVRSCLLEFYDQKTGRYPDVSPPGVPEPLGPLYGPAIHALCFQQCP